MRPGPMKENGLARWENIGSVRNATPSIRTRNVEWPIHVRLGDRAIAALSYGTRGAAPERGVIETRILRPKNLSPSMRPSSFPGTPVMPVVFAMPTSTPWR